MEWTGSRGTIVVNGPLILLLLAAPGLDRKSYSTLLCNRGLFDFVMVHGWNYIPNISLPDFYFHTRYFLCRQTFTKRLKISVVCNADKWRKFWRISCQVCSNKHRRILELVIKATSNQNNKIYLWGDGTRRFVRRKMRILKCEELATLLELRRKKWRLIIWICKHHKMWRFFVKNSFINVNIVKLGHHVTSFPYLSDAC